METEDITGMGLSGLVLNSEVVQVVNVVELEQSTPQHL